MLKAPCSAPRPMIATAGMIFLLAVLGQGSKASASYMVTAGIKPGTSLQSVNITLNGVTSNTGAGTLTAKIGAGPVLDAYCVDLYNVFRPGDQWLVDLLPIAQLQGSSGNPPPIGHGGGVGWLYQNFASVVSTNVERAGLQIAIWEMTYDGPSNLNLSSGIFRLNNNAAVAAKAQTYLNAFLASPTKAAGGLWVKAVSHRNNRNQDFVTVPEPEAGLLAGIGLAAVTGLYFRRRLVPRRNKMSI